MIRLLGSPKRLCLGPTRRDLLPLGDLQKAQGTGPRADHFGKARSCILLYKYGSPSSWTTSSPTP
jgi:hypothetical protein